MSDLPEYLPPLLAGALLALALALLSWRRRVRGSAFFALMMLAVAEWSALSALELAAPDTATKILCAKLEYIGIGAVPPLWLLFTVTFDGSWKPLSRRVIAGLWAIPAITVALALTNERHHLIWSRITSYPHATTLAYHHGPWFWIHAAYSYLLLVSGTVLLLRFVLRAPPAYRGQGAILLAGIAAPWLGNLVYLSGAVPVRGLDPTPFAFILSGLLLFVGLVRFRLLDLMPAARAALVESLVDGVVVVDASGRIVDINPAARRLLGDAGGTCIGHAAREMFAAAPELLAHWDARLSTAREVASPAAPGVYLEAHTVPLRAHNGRNTGDLLVLRDITERKRAEERAHLLEREQLARLQAEDALRIRADVLSTVVHDLKSPLGTVKGLTQLLQRQVGSGKVVVGPELDAKLGRIDSAVNKMARLINELLDVAQLEAGQPLVLEQHPTDLVALVERVSAEHRLSSSAATLDLETAERSLIGVWDAFRLERVFDNLLGNAIKYSPNGGVIRVTVRREQDSAVVEIVDHGVGIPAAEMPHLFQHFHRGHNVRKTPGTGLGLVGARRIVEEHGGRIDIRSEEGSGTTVVIHLPLRSVETLHAQANAGA